MKKLIPTLIVAMLASTSAYAATSSKVLDSGNSTTVSDTDCLILNTGVGIGLSANVEGTVYCREADGTNSSMILVGTCHAAGLAKIRQVNCIAKTSTVDGVETITYFPADCAAGVANVTVNGPSLFMADTATGGSMVEAALGGTCDAGTVEAFVNVTGAAI